MAKKKIYAVRKGHVTGLFHSWEECKKATAGYSGAEFRGFTEEAEARQFLNQRTSPSIADSQPENHGDGPGIQVPPDTVIAYVDGSFEASLGRYSYGCILLTPDGKTTTKSGNGENPDCAAIRNVAGEMLGAMTAAQWARQQGYSAIELRYDYEGIEKWVTGAWKAKMPQTQQYAQYMKRLGEKLTISFCKVAAHTGDYYNEQADQLAKAALNRTNTMK